MKKKVNCPHCKHRLGSVRNDSGRAILLDIGQKSTSRRVSQQISRRSIATDEKKIDVKTPSTLNRQFLIDQIGVKTDDFLDKQLQQVIGGQCNKLAWRAREVSFYKNIINEFNNTFQVREHFRRLWKNEQHIIRIVYPVFNQLSKNMSDNQCPMDMLFMETLLIPPSKFRPVRVFNGQHFESPSTTNYRKLMEIDEILRLLHKSETQSLAQANVNVSLFD